MRMARMVGVDVDTLHFDSLAALQAAHGDLVERMDQVRLEDFENVLFPSPPLRAKGDIEPVATPAMLFEEGRIQRNCVASYVERVAAGECYIYRVLQPERATLCVSRQQDQWQIAEIKARCNAPVSQGTKQAVQEWLTRVTPPRQRLLWEVDTADTPS
ncbi:MAG: PcfJ domain-containing protein [Planctomycetota bacterium]